LTPRTTVTAASLHATNGKPFGAKECLAPTRGAPSKPTTGANHTTHIDPCGLGESAPSRDSVNTVRPRPYGAPGAPC